MTSGLFLDLLPLFPHGAGALREGIRNLVDQFEPRSDVDFVLWRGEVSYSSNDVVGRSIPIHGHLKPSELDALTGEPEFFRVKHYSVVSTEFNVAKRVPERAFNVIVVQ